MIETKCCTGCAIKRGTDGLNSINMFRVEPSNKTGYHNRCMKCEDQTVNFNIMKEIADENRRHGDVNRDELYVQCGYCRERMPIEHFIRSTNNVSGRCCFCTFLNKEGCEDFLLELLKTRRGKGYIERVLTDDTTSAFWIAKRTDALREIVSAERGLVEAACKRIYTRELNEIRNKVIIGGVFGFISTIMLTVACLTLTS